MQKVVRKVFGGSLVSLRELKKLVLLYDESGYAQNTAYMKVYSKCLLFSSSIPMIPIFWKLPVS